MLGALVGVRLGGCSGQAHAAGRAVGTGALAHGQAGKSHDLYTKRVDSMDSRTVQSQQGAASQSKVAELLGVIKTRMPETYDQIKRKASEQGDEVYGLVRRGLRGEANCFWAVEAGQVVGTPFAQDHPISAVVAQALVQFGCAHVCIIAEVAHGKD